MTEQPDLAAARAARLLAGYVCGTHSGIHAIRQPVRVEAVVDAVRRSSEPGASAGEHHVIQGARWLPRGDGERRAHESLSRALATDAVVDLIVYGSIARGSTTGYSDVDAVLVVRDEVALDSGRLRELRRRVLVAERAVIGYQPMQHHGLQVVTPRLLTRASAALGMPPQTLTSTVSLFGRPVEAAFADPHVAADDRFRAFVQPLLTTRRWPDHAWFLHRAVAMFELVPVLYVQARGSRCEKHRSFAAARADFPDQWEPFDVLGEVRDRWPWERRRMLERASATVRNPWTAVAVWRRLPCPVPATAGALLDDEALEGLKRVIRSMEAALS